MGANKVYDLGHTIFFVKPTGLTRVFFYTRLPNAGITTVQAHRARTRV